MTRTKAKRLIDEMINKYGDVVVAKTYDYWASKCYVKEGEDTNTIIAEIHLSEVEVPACRADFKKLEDIVLGKEGIDYIPINVPASKVIYDSEEQRECRERAKKSTQRLAAKYAVYLPYLMLTDFYR